MDFVTRQISIPQVTPSADNVLRIPVVLDSAGDEVGLEIGFTFNPEKYAFKYFVLSDAPYGTGYGSSTGGGFANIGITGSGAYSAGQHTIGELALGVIGTADVHPIIEIASATARDAGGNALDITSYSANSAGFSAEAPQLTPIGAVIDPATGGITVGHIDQNGQVHVATRPQTGATKDDGTIFGLSPLMLGVIAVGAFLVLKK